MKSHTKNEKHVLLVEKSIWHVLLGTFLVILCIIITVIMYALLLCTSLAVRKNWFHLSKNVSSMAVVNVFGHRDRVGNIYLNSKVKKYTTMMMITKIITMVMIEGLCINPHTAVTNRTTNCIIISISFTLNQYGQSIDLMMIIMIMVL